MCRILLLISFAANVLLYYGVIDLATYRQKVDNTVAIGTEAGKKMLDINSLRQEQKEKLVGELLKSLSGATR